jgi:hypothetical protein
MSDSTAHHISTSRAVWLAEKVRRPVPVTIQGEVILLAPGAAMGAELIDPQLPAATLSATNSAGPNHPAA